MTFHLFDGDGWTKHATYEEAAEAAEESIGIAQRLCSPEWPDWVEEIAIYEAPDDCEEPGEDGAQVAYSKMCNEREAEEGDGCDFWCDYVISQVAPRAAPTEPGVEE